ncbi:hypothetical protein BDZ91DRAFT_840756 [Kalaharituber pfeilii]|nr:hypothetical protein BDZ91DRAFT_840756 [Kalaharituber pfeilii]
MRVYYVEYQRLFHITQTTPAILAKAVRAPRKCRLVPHHDDMDPLWYQWARQKLSELINQTGLVWEPGERWLIAGTPHKLRLPRLITPGFFLACIILPPLPPSSCDVFSPLNLSSSSFHLILENLKNYVTLLRAEDMVRLISGQAYYPLWVLFHIVSATGHKFEAR